MDFMEVSDTFTIKHKTIIKKIFEESYKHTFDGNYSCDLIIKCGEKLSEYSAHQTILASVSQFLYEALLTANPGKIAVLILPDLEPKTLEQILSYVYTGEITLKKGEDLFKFIEGCQYLGIHEPLHENPNEIQHKMEVSEENLVDLTSDLSDYELTEPQVSLTIDKIPVLEPERKKIRSRRPKIYDSYKNLQKIDDDNFCQSRESNADPKIDYGALTEEQRKIALEKAKKCLLYVYESSDRRPDGSLDKIVEKTKLNYEGKTLKRALHKCGFCGHVFSLCLGMNFTWLNSSFRKHLKNQHGVKNLVKRSMSSKENVSI